MSAGGSAHVQLVDHVGLKHMIMNAAKVSAQAEGFSATMIINGEIRPGWEFAGVDMSGHHKDDDKYAIILRHPIDDAIGTAEYTCVFVDGHGGSVDVVQYVLIQNDNDYVNRDLDRFAILIHELASR